MLFFNFFRSSFEFFFFCSCAPSQSAFSSLSFQNKDPPVFFCLEQSEQLVVEVHFRPVRSSFSLPSAVNAFSHLSRSRQFPFEIYQSIYSILALTTIMHQKRRCRGCTILHYTVVVLSSVHLFKSHGPW